MCGCVRCDWVRNRKGSKTILADVIFGTQIRCDCDINLIYPKCPEQNLFRCYSYLFSTLRVESSFPHTQDALLSADLRGDEEINCEFCNIDLHS